MNYVNIYPHIDHSFFSISSCRSRLLSDLIPLKPEELFLCFYSASLMEKSSLWIFVYLKIYFFHFQFWRIFSLDIDILVDSIFFFFHHFKYAVSLFSSHFCFHWDISCHSYYWPFHIWYGIFFWYGIFLLILLRFLKLFNCAFLRCQFVCIYPV